MTVGRMSVLVLTSGFAGEQGELPTAGRGCGHETSWVNPGRIRRRACFWPRCVRFTGFCVKLGGRKSSWHASCSWLGGMNTTQEFDLPTSGTVPLNPDDWVERHGEYLLNFAVGQLRDRVAAEDLVQETLLAAIRALGRYAGQSTERTWLTGILRHKILDHLRQAKRRHTVPLTTTGERGGDALSDESLLWVHEVADECASPCHRLDLEEFRGALIAALGSLPPRIAQVFELYEMRDLSTKEICAELAISPNNLWVMLHRARKQLRDCLAKAWGDTTAEAMPSNA